MRDYYSQQMISSQMINEWHKQAERDRLVQEAKRSELTRFFRQRAKVAPAASQIRPKTI
jgi:hypothetical protein